MRNVKFHPRQVRFLELYFSGLSIQNAVLGAGYRGSSPQALCNTGRAILDKLSKNPDILFRQTGGVKITQLLVDIAENNKSEHQQLKALKILAALL